MKTISIVGSTGFIGGHLASRYSNPRLFGRSNILELAKDKSDLVVIAAAPAAKWIANSRPKEDLENIKRLIDSLQCIKSRQCVLISTIDTFPIGVEFDELSPLPINHPEGYGANRGYLETALSQTLENLHIIRLPGMYGPGLKKNLIYDLMHKKEAPLLNCESLFQFYDVRSLPGHIGLCLDFDLKILNLASESVSVTEIYEYVFELKMNRTDAIRMEYKMKTKYSREIAGRKENYLMSKEEVLAGIRQWVISEKND